MNYSKILFIIRRKKKENRINRLQDKIPVRLEIKRTTIKIIKINN